MMTIYEDDLTVGELREVCVAVSATIRGSEPKRLSVNFHQHQHCIHCSLLPFSCLQFAHYSIQLDHLQPNSSSVHILIMTPLFTTIYPVHQQSTAT